MDAPFSHVLTVCGLRHRIHLLIGGGWYLGVSMKRLTSWYHTLYNHSFR